MSRTTHKWPQWLLITLLVLAILVFLPLGWMLFMGLWGGGMMAGGVGIEGMMHSGGMGMGMGMGWLGLVGVGVLVLLLVVAISLLIRALQRGRRPPEPPSA